jgi:hypothetical protein
MPASELPPSTVPALPTMRKPEITEYMIEAEAERLYYSTRKPRECFSWRSQSAGAIGFELRAEAKAKLEAQRKAAPSLSLSRRRGS